MNTINANVKIVIVGTKHSLILDPGEDYEITFKKGDPLREDLYDLNDLIDNTFNTAYSNGDMVKAIFIDNKNIIHDQIETSLRENNLSSDETLIELSRLPQFCNADPSDLYDIISEIAHSLSNQK